MPDTYKSTSDAKQDLAERLSGLRAGMLGIEGSQDHMRPMSHFSDMDEGTIWFMTSRDTDLARQIGTGATAHYCVVDGSDGFYACLRGTIEQSDNAEKLDDIWNHVAAAWFSGRDDPDLLLVKMTLRDAEVWRSIDSGLQFGLEIVRANLNPDKQPDVGTRDNILF